MLLQASNTPWGESVTFVFNPSYDVVPKPEYISPFMVSIFMRFCFFLVLYMHLFDMRLILVEVILFSITNDVFILDSHV